MDNRDSETLREEYRQFMESQRDNTRIAYSWIGSIFLVLCSGLFFLGLTSGELARFVPAMILGIGLSLVWVGLTETFARYTRQRFQRLSQITKELGIPPIEPPELTNIDRLLRRVSRRVFLLRGIVQRLPLTEARTYVVLFVVLYNVAWVVRFVLEFFTSV